MSQLRTPDLDPTPIRFNRRRGPRWFVDGTAVAIRTAGERFGLVHRLRSIDLGLGGMGALSDSPIEPGTPVLAGFESPLERHRAGVVVRCTACEGGYRIAMRFDARRAA